MTRLTKLPKRLEGMIDQAVSTGGNTTACDVPKESKYHNSHVLYDDRWFDSKAERDHYIWLRAREQAGQISELRCQPRYVLQEGHRYGNDRRARAIKYIPDFDYLENGQRVAVDVKGVRTAVFNIKEKLFREKYPDIRLEIVPVKQKGKKE